MHGDGTAVGISDEVNLAGELAPRAAKSAFMNSLPPRQEVGAKGVLSMRSWSLCAVVSACLRSLDGVFALGVLDSKALLARPLHSFFPVRVYGSLPPCVGG
jgi:hypothetical protein